MDRKGRRGSVRVTNSSPCNLFVLYSGELLPWIVNHRDTENTEVAQKRATDSGSEGFVNKTDDYSGDDPLEEVSRSLSESESRSNVEVHIIVQHIAHGEDANENAHARALRSA